jgi:tRNA nucleotidyltransferase (CCA-adding enzyme)
MDSNMVEKILEHAVNPDLLKLRALFQAEGFDIRIVGGAVRDILCGQTPKDIDLCTDAFPDEAIAIYDKAGIRFVPTGIDHGTISVIMNEETYEITSLRYDTETDGRHAKVTFTRLWYEDLARRDLTINAMSMTFDGVLDDPYGGRRDLEAHSVQFVGSPALRIQEDYLRILRYFRFAGRFGSGHFDEIQINAIKQFSSGLKQVSRERVWQEVSKMMTHSSAPVVYKAMADADVLEHADLPSVSDARLERLRVAIQHTTNFATVFSTLFKTKDQVADFGKRLKISTKDIRLMQYLVQFRDYKSKDDDVFIRRLQESIVFQGATVEYAVEAALMLGRSAVADYIKQWTIPVFPITGDDLKALGMQPGKEMGSMLTSVKYAWFNVGMYEGHFQDHAVMIDVCKTSLEQSK